MHVDLTVVPQAFRDCVASHSRVINGEITDISKSSFSANRTFRDDNYFGPVIIKTVLNSAGNAEYRARYNRAQRLAHKARRQYQNLGWPAALQPDGLNKYALLNEKDQVPPEVWDDPHWVVEKFRPEQHEGHYVLREWYFLHDREYVNCETSHLPIISEGETRPDLALPPPPALRELRTQLKLDYGKIDYSLETDGNLVLYDINKTPMIRNPITETGRAIINALAPGLNYANSEK